MKNPFKYIRHIVKDPVTTIPEAKARKKEMMPFFAGSIGAMVLGVTLQTITDIDSFSYLSFAALISTAFWGFWLCVLADLKRKIKALTCEYCNSLPDISTSEDFEKYVSYNVEKDEAIFKGYSGNKSPTNGKYSLVKFSASSAAIVSVILTCPHCGEIRHLKYYAEPFKCHAQATNVSAHQFAEVSNLLSTAVRTAVNDYNDPEKRVCIPYTLHSSKNPHFEQRTTFIGANAQGARPNYAGAKLDYRKDTEEMLEHFFVLNDLNGRIISTTASVKQKPLASISPEKNLDITKSDNQFLQDNGSQDESSIMPKKEIRTTDSSKITVAADEIEVNASERNSETASVVLQEESLDVKKRPTIRENFRKTIIVISAICTLLIVSGIIVGVISTRHNRVIADKEINVPTEQVSDSSENVISDNIVEEISITDYVGYWTIKEDYQKELTVISGDDDSVCFSLYYDNSTEISSVVARLQNNAAVFSLATNGAVIKGTLLFDKDAITVDITYSTQSEIPVEVMEFTELHMVSQIYSENDDLAEESIDSENLPDYILPHSSYELLTEEDVCSLTKNELSLARNEIFARHGRKFSDESLQTYFNEKIWYSGYIEPDDFSTSMLSDIEITNVDFIKYYERLDSNTVEDISYIIKVHNEVHNVYQYPFYSSEVLQVLPMGEYTIVTEYTDIDGTCWGQLELGSGWICMDAIESEESNGESYGFCYQCDEEITEWSDIFSEFGLCEECFGSEDLPIDDWCANCGRDLPLNENNLCDFCSQELCVWCNGPLGDDDAHDCNDYPNVICPECGWGMFTTGVGIDGVVCPECDTRII